MRITSLYSILMQKEGFFNNRKKYSKNDNLKKKDHEYVNLSIIPEQGADQSQDS